MNVIENAEKECAVLGSLFQGIVNEMKNSSTLWEDLTCKANKMHLQLKSTISTFSLFLDAFQRIADLATNTKDYKKLRNELRKKALETTKLQKKCRKCELHLREPTDQHCPRLVPKHDILHNKLYSTIQEVSNYYGMLEEREKQALRSATIEERSRFCTLFTLLEPVMELEVSLASEMSHIEDLVQCLAKHTAEPHCLPAASEQVIKDIKGIDYSTIVAFKREVDGSSSPLLVVCSTLNAWAKRPEIPLKSKHSATVSGAPEGVKNCRPAITAHTFDPPSPSLFEKPNWQIYEETHQRAMTISEDGMYGTLSRQHSIPSRRCRIRDLSLERHSPMREQHYQSTMNNISNGRIKPTQPPTVPADYYGTMTNRSSPGRIRDFSSDEPEESEQIAQYCLYALLKNFELAVSMHSEHQRISTTDNVIFLDDANQRLRSSTLPAEAIAPDVRTIVWRDRARQNGSVGTSQYGTYYGRPSFDSADETLDESSHPPNQQQKNDTLRRGTSIALNPNEKPAPPIRRTPSMNTNHNQQQTNSGYIELQSRLKARLKRAEEMAGQADLIQIQQQQKTTTVVSRSNPPDDEFPPPPPDFLLSNDPKPPPPTTNVHTSLLSEIQRGMKLRKTMTDRDRSAPRIR
uniref:MTSS1-like protein A-like protein n=1 Tax=Adineta vaga complex sp. C JFF-2016 TaxID=1813166 RepID=A0A142CCQ6_9BILA|nr:MTSS1-like protein A-like protein [Adineta vaga complex sp. C JFF-2016]